MAPDPPGSSGHVGTQGAKHLLPPGPLLRFRRRGGREFRLETEATAAVTESAALDAGGSARRVRRLRRRGQRRGSAAAEAER